jgi:hypothetical protein
MCILVPFPFVGYGQCTERAESVNAASKRFFFEKKKQKIVICWGRGDRGERARRTRNFLVFL